MGASDTEWGQREVAINIRLGLRIPLRTAISQNATARSQALQARTRPAHFAAPSISMLYPVRPCTLQTAAQACAVPAAAAIASMSALLFPTQQDI